LKYNIIAVDFDGTLCFDKYPGTGNLNMYAVGVLIKYRRMGGKLILWTCRYDKPLDDAVEACRQAGLEFDAVNENDPEHAAKWATKNGTDKFSPKVYADLYIDDKALKFSEVNKDNGLDWFAINKEIFGGDL
jgi:hypothetical protein